MSAPPTDLTPLDQLGAHPRLQALARRAPAGLDVGQAARTLAYRLVGAPLARPDPLGGLLTTIAGKELTMLESQCRASPGRTAAATVALMEALLPGYFNSAGKPRRPVEPTGEPAPKEPPEPPEPQLEMLRASLSTLMGRKVPADFPLPTAAVARHADDPVRVAAALSRRLRVGSAVARAWAALTQFERAVGVLESLLPGLGWDFSTSTLRRTLTLNLERLAALLERLPVLQRIVDELGRLESSARTSLVAEHGGRETVVGVKVGGELSDVLPSELALLAQPETEDLFYQRFIEHRLLCLELQGVAQQRDSPPEQKGPIIACVDTSGSMQGAPEAVAKALILAMIRSARPDRRAVRLIFFGGPGNYTELDISHKRTDLERLLEFLTMGFHAGTDYDGPLLRAIRLLGEPIYDKADVIIITDGLCRASRKVIDQVQQAKQERMCRVLSVIVGGDASAVARFSDEVWNLNPSSAAEPGLNLRRWLA